MSDQNKFHCNHKGMHFSDPGFKEICKEQCAACADFAPQDGGYSKEHQNKLTPEERSIICSSCHGSGGGMLNNGDGYMECINCDGEPIAKATWSHLQYAAQQTAAKDARIAELEKMIDPIGEKADGPHTAAEFIIDKIPGAQSQDWYMPVLIAACSYAMYHTSRCNEVLLQQDERIKELKQALEITGTKIGVSNMRIKTFEKATEEKNDLLKVKDARIAELENKYNKSCKDRDNSDGWATEMKRQRDQAFALLEEVRKILYFRRFEDLFQRVKTLLSSRENKKPEQVDIVCPLCNGKGFTWALNRIGDDDSKECPRCKGIGKTTENKKPPYPENYDDAQFEAFNEQLP